MKARYFFRKEMYSSKGQLRVVSIVRTDGIMDTFYTTIDPHSTTIRSYPTWIAWLKDQGSVEISRSYFYKLKKQALENVEKIKKEYNAKNK